jgi:hypothetical protein
VLRGNHIKPRPSGSPHQACRPFVAFTR